MTFEHFTDEELQIASEIIPKMVSKKVEIPAAIQKAAYDLGAAIRHHIATSKTDLIHHDPVIDEMIVKALVKAADREPALGGITPAQHRLLKGIKAFIDEMGFSPTYQEMMAMADVKSKNTINRLMTGLQDRGHIHFKAGRTRSVVVLGVIA